MFKLIVIAAMIVIIMAMFVSAKNIFSQNRVDGRTLLSLKWRVGLSVFLFILLFFAFAFGFIQPHSL